MDDNTKRIAYLAERYFQLIQDSSLAHEIYVSYLDCKENYGRDHAMRALYSQVESIFRNTAILGELEFEFKAAGDNTWEDSQTYVSLKKCHVKMKKKLREMGRKVDVETDPLEAQIYHITLMEIDHGILDDDDPRKKELGQKLEVLKARYAHDRESFLEKLLSEE